MKKLILCLTLLALSLLISSVSAQLIVSPDNQHYFEYKGKPMVLFLYHGGLSRGLSGNFIYEPSTISENLMKRASEFGNHMYLHVNRGYRDVDWDGAFDKMNDDGNWQALRDVCKWSEENDVILSLVFWSYKWNFDGQEWTGSDLLRDMDSGVSNGRTKRDLIESSLKKAVEACWEYPSVTFNFMWEYNVRINRGDDRDGAIYRWWVDRVNEEGRKIDPKVNHLFSLEYGGEHPSVRNADFITEEDGNGFWKSGADLDDIKSYNVPLVFWASDWWFEDEVGTAIGPSEYRQQVKEDTNPAGAFAPATDEGLEYTLQARWYMENNDFSTNVPNYRSSSRPRISNPSGYVNGRSGSNFAVDYSGGSPALSEVWVDKDGDCRFFER